MPQVLKEEVRERLVAAATTVFFERGFADARISDIATLAEVSTGLVYSYFKNKGDLFAAVVSPLSLDFEEIARQEEVLIHSSPLDRYKEVTQEHIAQMLQHHRELVIVMDKSAGTVYEGMKSEFVKSVQAHIARRIGAKSCKVYPDILPHVLASNFVEGVLEVARHYESPQQAKELLDLFIGCYYDGVNAL